MQVVIDWLQINCKGKLIESPLFKVKPTGKRSQTFANIEEIYYKSKIVAIAANMPLQSFLPPETNIIKFENSVLYSPEFPAILHGICFQMGVRFSGITRIDLALDFNEFANHRNPENLIRQYLSGSLTYWGKTMFKSQGRNVYNLTPDYLRFGSNESLISAYLYRKNLEMKVKVWKPYISKNWKMNQIDTARDVWRLEFSIKGSQHTLVEKESGESSKITLATLTDYETLHNIYFSLVNKYFQFCHIKRGNHRNTKQFLKLFDVPFNIFLFFIFNETQDSSRKDRIMIKKLENLNFELRSQKNDLWQAAEDLSQYIAESKGLENYRELVALQ